MHLGGSHGFICTIVDITHEKSAELSQREAAQEAVERKKQQERFIDMISHVRNGEARLSERPELTMRVSGNPKSPVGNPALYRGH